MKKNALIIIITIALTWFCIWFFSNDADLMQQNKELIKERDSLYVANKTLYLINDSIITLKQKEVVKYVKIKESIKTIQDETKNAINGVLLLNERQIDSTIRTHKHIIRN